MDKCYDILRNALRRFALLVAAAMALHADAQAPTEKTLPPVPAKTAIAYNGKAKPQAQTTALPGFHYDRLLRADEFEKYRRPEAVHKIQQDLALIYHDDPDFLRDVALGHKPLTDNIMGPVTLFWMQRYCYTFRIEPIGNFADGLVESIDSFAHFAEKHLDDKNLILTHDFEKWMDARPPDKRQADYAIRRIGSDADRQALVAEYLKRSTRKQAKPSSGQIFSYRIDQADIELMRAKPDILQGLASFPGKPYADVAEFDTAIATALKDVPPDVIKRFLPDIESAAKVGGYRITDLSIQRMQDLGVPDDLVHAVEPLQGSLYEAKGDMEDAMKIAAADAKAAAFDKYRDRMNAAAEIGTYSIDAGALKRLDQVFSSQGQKPVVPLPMLGIINELTGVNYPTSDLFDKAATAKIWYSLGTCQTNLPTYDKYVRSLALKDDAYTALKDAVVNSVSGGDAKASSDMAARFEAMQSLRKLNGVCTDDQNNSAQILAAEIYQFYRPALVDIVMKSAPAREKPVNWSGGAWGVKNGAVVSSCGCVLDDLSGQVYAFYPFWLAPPPPAKGDAASNDAAASKQDDNPPQVIDFNVLSRVGFVGFTFDDNGNLKPAPNRYDIDYDFVKVAQGFRSKVDWVIRRDDWTSWNALNNREQVDRFRKLKQDIVNFLGKAGGDGVTLFFVGYPDFDQLSEENDNAIGEFDQFVRELSTALHDTGKGYGLNIVLRQPRELVKDSSEHATAKVNDYDHMLQLLKLINPDDTRRMVNVSDKPLLDRASALFRPALTSQTRNHILLLIEEPTTDAKKRLRLEIEQALHGEERHALLSGVIPVIEFDGRNWQQLQDDMIYFKDNFDGIGFWPVNFHQASTMPTGNAMVGDSHCDHGETVEECLVSTYQGYNLNSKDNSLAEKFVCQFHNWFRAVLALQLAVFLVAYLVPLFTCYMREWISQNFKVLVANFFGMVVVGALLFAWDPDLSSTRAHAVIVVLLLLAIGFEAIRRRREFILRTVKPSRAKSAMLERNRHAANGDGEMEQKPQRGEQAHAGDRYVGVLKAVVRLRTYLESGKNASADLRRELQADIGVLSSYLDIDEKEGVSTRLKIMKAAQVVTAHIEDSHSPVSPQKMRRLAVLLWSYLNGNIDVERKVLAQLEPFLQKFEEGTAWGEEDKQAFGHVLHQAQQAVAQREKTEHGEFAAMKAGIALMRRNLEEEQHATPAAVSAMQVVWQHVDRDELLHGRQQIASDDKAEPKLMDSSNAAPMLPWRFYRK